MKLEEFFERVKQECLARDINPLTLNYEDMDKATQFLGPPDNDMAVKYTIRDIGIYTNPDAKLYNENDNIQEIAKQMIAPYYTDNTYNFFVFLNEYDDLEFISAPQRFDMLRFNTKNAECILVKKQSIYLLGSKYKDPNKDCTIYVKDIGGFTTNTTESILQMFRPFREVYGHFHIYKENNI